MNDLAMLDDVTGLIATLEAQNKQAAQSTAPAFTPFSFVESDELGLSRILGWLLDPNGTHAQGERFLEAFVKALGIPWQPSHCATARITLEAPTPRLTQLRRIDVLIASQDRAIAIENKPSAADQREQVQDYFTHLDRHYQSGGHLLYLSGDGSGPSLESVRAEEAERRRQSGQLIVKGYADLLPWLEACRGLCLAPRVSDFIAFFERHIRRRFIKGEKTVALSEQLVSDIVSSPDRVSSALNIIAAADALRERLITRLREEIALLAAARGWTLLPEKRSVIQWSGFSIRYGANDELEFRLEFGDERRSLSYFGIWGIGPGHADYLPAAALLTEAFGRGRQSHVWPWHRIPDLQDALFPMEGNWFASDVPWRAIADGSLSPKIIAAAQVFYDALAPNGFVGRR